MANLETIKKILREIIAAYPGRFKMEDDSVKAWTVYLVDIDDDLLVNSVRSFISSSIHAFPPSIPEIRKEATKIRRTIASVPDVWSAWIQVEQADSKRTNELEMYEVEGEEIRTHYARAFTHPIVWIVASGLGWPDKFPDPDNINTSRAHFRDAYTEALGNATKEDMQLQQVKEFTSTEREMKRLAQSMERPALIHPHTGERLE